MWNGKDRETEMSNSIDKKRRPKEVSSVEEGEEVANNSDNSNSKYNNINSNSRNHNNYKNRDDRNNNNNNRYERHGSNSSQQNSPPERWQPESTSHKKQIDKDDRGQIRNGKDREIEKSNSTDKKKRPKQLSVEEGEEVECELNPCNASIDTIVTSSIAGVVKSMDITSKSHPQSIERNTIGQNFESLYVDTKKGGIAEEILNNADSDQNIQKNTVRDSIILINEGPLKRLPVDNLMDPTDQPSAKYDIESIVDKVVLQDPSIDKDILNSTIALSETVIEAKPDVHAPTVDAYSPAQSVLCNATLTSPVAAFNTAVKSTGGKICYLTSSKSVAKSTVSNKAPDGNIVLPKKSSKNALDIRSIGSSNPTDLIVALDTNNRRTGSIGASNSTSPVAALATNEKQTYSTEANLNRINIIQSTSVSDYINKHSKYSDNPVKIEVNTAPTIGNVNSGSKICNLTSNSGSKICNLTSSNTAVKATGGKICYLTSSKPVVKSIESKKSSKNSSDIRSGDTYKVPDIVSSSTKPKKIEPTVTYRLWHGLASSSSTNKKSRNLK
jgi:hypothetical protein